MPKMRPQYVVLAVAVTLFAVLLILAVSSDQPGRVVNRDGVITRTIAVVDTNADVTFQLRLVEGSDAEHESAHIFEALGGLRGVGHASLNTATITLNVTYIDSVIDQASIAARLQEAGYLAPAQ